MEIDLADVERELCRIPEVRAARIVADANGTPVEVHVLASPGKHAKQVVRDVQSVAMATVGLELDHRIVSVVQLDDGNGAAAAPTPIVPTIPDSASAATNGSSTRVAVLDDDRINIDSVVCLRRGLAGTAEVALRRGGEVVTGLAEGSIATSALKRLVAEATLDALRQLEPEANRASVESAVLTRLGDRDVAVTTIALVVPPNEDVVTGSAPVRVGGEHEALARAVLDALNRRLRQLG